MHSPLVAGLDIGSTKTAVVIAEVAEPLKVLGVGQARTSGVRREIVTDIEATTESIRRAVKEAELMAGVSVERLYTGIGGDHIHGWPSHGVVAVGREEIVQKDVDRVHEVAQAIAIPADRELLHAIPQEYIVDAQRGIRYPVGIAGMRLEAEVYIVTGSAPAAQNIRKSIARAGYAVEELVLEPLASSLAVLTEEEKEMGVALVELGGGTTDVLIFHEGKIRHLATLPWGGSTVTNDIVKGLSLPYGEAVRVKERWGAARADLVDPYDTFELSGGAPGTTRPIARELLAHIIEQRMDEIFGLVAEQITRSGLGDQLGAGIMLTGGGAALPAMMELAERTFAAPVRCGIPGEGLGGLVDSIRHPKFATVTGLVLYGARRLTADGFEGGAAVGGRPINGMIKWMRNWLRDFF